MEPGSSAVPMKTFALLARLATVCLLVLICQQARAVLMPIALAAVLAFILTPPMKVLQRKLARLPALFLVMLLAVSALGCAGYVLAEQLNQLTTQLGTYSGSMHNKVAALQDTDDGPLARVQVMIAKVTEGLEKKADPDNKAVHIVPVQVSVPAHLWRLVAPLAEPLITALFILVLCVFMLGQRDDLRNRLISLVGTGNVTLTTRTLDEGAQRITRYLLDQTMINAAFGALVGVGLYFIGIPYAALWGAVAAVARFVPYLGSIASMTLPALLAFAIFPGWGRTFLVIGLFMGMDGLIGYGVEPLLIGSRTGVSSIALLISALFWTWLWGPGGLVLATPITVSLAVLGRHVPGLQFLSVLLGDAQVIGVEISFYQRLLARDEEEASELARAQQGALGATAAMDGIILPTLVLAARDLASREITADDEAFIVTWSRDIAEKMTAREPAAAPDTDVDPGANYPDPRPNARGATVRALGIAAHRPGSELLLDLLAAALPPGSGKLEVLAQSTPLGELIARVAEVRPDVLCIAALPPEGGPYARQLCHRLKARFPNVAIVAFRPDAPGTDGALAARRLLESGADAVVSTLAQATAELSQRLGREAIAA